MMNNSIIFYEVPKRESSKTLLSDVVGPEAGKYFGALILNDIRCCQRLKGWYEKEKHL